MTLLVLTAAATAQVPGRWNANITAVYASPSAAVVARVTRPGSFVFDPLCTVPGPRTTGFGRWLGSTILWVTAEHPAANSTLHQLTMPSKPVRLDPPPLCAAAAAAVYRSGDDGAGLLLVAADATVYNWQWSRLRRVPTLGLHGVSAEKIRHCEPA